MSIKIENLSFTYDKKTTFAQAALKNINLDICDGDFLGIIGHTGSGKSTLVNHLNALTKVQTGKIYVGDMDLTVKKLDYKRLRSTVGMVFQYPEYQLFAASVAEDVAFGPKNVGLADDEIARRVKAAIELVGLDYEEIKERSPFELSGGQMRRVALAGVVAMQPDVLVLDEPTAGLDPKGKYEIMQLIKRLKASCSVVIMISHNMDEVAAYCNKIAVLNKGELKCVISPRELYARRDELAQYKIDLPQVTRIAASLVENGLNIDTSVINEEELIRGVLAAKEGKL